MNKSYSPLSLSLQDNNLSQSGVHWVIVGQVQGVGYRQAMQRQAKYWGLTGWCANRAEGTVEAEVYGTPDQIAALYAWCQSGPPSAQVNRILVEPSPVIDAPVEFTIRR